MKKMAWGFVSFVLIVTVLVGCGFSTFSGSKTGDDDHFDIEFDILNTSFSHDLKLDEGESLDVSITRESGDIAIVIQCGDDEPVYRGNGMDSFDFQVTVPSEGLYTITVSGKNAKGHVVVKRATD